jgi:hypothetical protein
MPLSNIRCEECGRDITAMFYKFRGILYLDRITRDCLCLRNTHELREYVNSEYFRDELGKEYDRIMQERRDNDG